MSSYDSWKTQNPDDDRNRGAGRSNPRPVEQWRTCPVHGWAEHAGFIGGIPTCVACASNAATASAQRFNVLMGFVLGPRPE